MIISLLFSLSLGVGIQTITIIKSFFLRSLSFYINRPSSPSSNALRRERARFAFVARDTLSVLAIADVFTASLLSSSYYHRTEIIIVY